MISKKLRNQIKSEIRFLQSDDIKSLVHEADIDCCHQDSEVINKRIVYLKRRLKGKTHKRVKR